MSQRALLKLRTSQNRRAAYRRLRSTRNRKAALLKLRAKTLVYRARPSASTASAASGILKTTAPAVAQGHVPLVFLLLCVRLVYPRKVFWY